MTIDLLLLIAMASFGVWQWRVPIATQVVFNHQADYAASYQKVQQITNSVALIVDSLIPGQVETYPRNGIVCFIAPLTWKDNLLHPPPITLIGQLEDGEPQGTTPYTVRIALAEDVVRSRDKNDPETIFELAHELAHVKMDATYDNYLSETFAMALSLQVLSDLGFNEYREEIIKQYVWDESSLPQSIKLAINSQRWNEVVLFWQNQSKTQKINQYGKFDPSFEVVGALILEASHQPVWSDLLGFSALSEECVLNDGTLVSVPDQAVRFKICRPALSLMKKLRPALKALGYIF